MDTKTKRIATAREALWRAQRARLITPHMAYFGWNKIGKRFDVFRVIKESPDHKSIIGATVATFKTQRECEADCLMRNREVTAAMGLREKYGLVAA